MRNRAWCSTCKPSIVIGLGIAGMHYVGMAAMHSSATAYYQPALFALSIAIAIGASFAALWVAGYLREGSGVVHQLLKYGASLMLGAGIFSMHFTGMAALQSGSARRQPACAAASKPATCNWA